jgi:hypothetical protein
MQMAPRAVRSGEETKHQPRLAAALPESAAREPPPTCLMIVNNVQTVDGSLVAFYSQIFGR